MKQLIINFPDRNYTILEKVCRIQGVRMEDVAREVLQERVTLALEQPLGEILELGLGPTFEHVFEKEEPEEDLQPQEGGAE